MNSNNCLTHSNKGVMLLQRNRNFSTTFNALYLYVSNNLLTHSLLISKTAFILLYTCAKRAVFSINKRFPQGFFCSTLFLLRHLQRRHRRNRLAGAEEVNSRNTAPLFTNYFRCDGVSLWQRLLTLHILIRHTKIVTRWKLTIIQFLHHNAVYCWQVQLVISEDL